MGLSSILYVLHSLVSYVLHVYRRKITNRNRKIASIDIKKEDDSLKFDDIVSSIKGTSFQKHSHPLSISIYEIIVIKPPNKYLLHNFDLFFSNLCNNCLCFTQTLLCEVSINSIGKSFVFFLPALSIIFIGKSFIV